MTRIYCKNPQTAGRIIDGQAFVVTPDDNKLHTLNATATRLWEIAVDGITVERAAQDLVDRFAVDMDAARADVEKCLEDFVAREIFVVQ